jgi:endonuclease-3
MTSANQTTKPARRPRKPKKPKATAQDVLEQLGKEYGPAVWEPRYDATSELVFTILSQHTSDLNSERAFINLMKTFETFDAIASAPVEQIEEAIRRGGLAKTKAPRIKKVLNDVYDELGSFDLSFLAEMPLDEAKAWLKKFDGIGPKTAAIILSFALGMPAMPVDTHIYRVSQRLGLIGPKVTADQAHDILEPMVAPDEVFAFHVYLIEHGRKVCKAQRPKCNECVLGWGCPSQFAFDKPSKPAKSATRPRRQPK